jgi:hypothetical protein
VGAGLLVESLWAWWAGLVIAVLTVALELILESSQRGWMVWLGFVVIFIVSAVQGSRDERSRPVLRAP